MNDNAKKWVAALRSGEFEQCSNALHIVDDGYCCLGVGCELYRRENPEALSTEVIERDLEQHGTVKVVAYNGIFGSMPPSVMDWLGLRTSSGAYDEESHNLAHANDQGISFEEIADIIESEPEGLFVNA